MISIFDRPAWLQLFDTFSPARDLARVRDAVTPDLLDARDEYGMTALHHSVSMKWLEAVELLLAAGADRETRYFRTGETPLYSAVQDEHVEIVGALLRAGANPDAANYWG